MVRPPYWTVARVLQAAEQVWPAFHGSLTWRSGVDAYDLDLEQLFNTFVVWYQQTQLETDVERQAWLARIFAVPPAELARVAHAQGAGGYEQAVSAGVPRRRSRVRSSAGPVAALPE